MILLGGYLKKLKPLVKNGNEQQKSNINFFEQNLMKNLNHIILQEKKEISLPLMLSMILDQKIS